MGDNHISEPSTTLALLTPLISHDCHNDCRFGHSSKKTPLLLCNHITLTLSTNGHSLQGSSQRDHCGEQTKGSNDLDNFSPKKIPSFFKDERSRRLPAVPKGR